MSPPLAAAVPKGTAGKEQKLGTLVTLAPGLPDQTGQRHITLLLKPHKVHARLSRQEKVAGTPAGTQPSDTVAVFTV